MAEGLAGLIGAYGSDEEDVEEMEAEEAGGQVTILGRSDEDEEMGGVDLSHLTAPALQQLDTASTQPPTAAATAAAAAAGPPLGPEQGGDEQLPDAPAAGPCAAGDEEPGAAAPGEARSPAGGAEPAAPPASVLPPEVLAAPPGECDPGLQAKVATWLNVQRTRGRFINRELRHSRGYRNPEFFRKMVEHLEIDEYGSSFVPEVFDPHGLPKEDFIEELQKEWAAEEERRKAARQATGRIEFTKSASQPQLAHNPLLPGLNPAAALAAAQLKAAQLAAGAAGLALGAAPQPQPAGGGGGKSGKWDAVRR